MRHRSTLFSVACALLALALPGCAGFGGTNPATGAAAAEQAVSPNAPPAIDGMAGEYAGTVKDGLLGKGGVILELSQSGASIGGIMQLKFATASATSSLALTAAADKTGGTGIVILKASPPCSVTMTGTYDPATITLRGKYVGFHNCTQTGTFLVKEQCYYVIAKPKGDVIRPRTLPRAC